MFGWVDRLLASAYRRGRAITEGEDKITDERRTAVRAVRDAIGKAMRDAEHDREHGARESNEGALTAAAQASATVHEVDDEEARRLVLAWKAAFDAIPKGWKERAQFDSPSRTPGYPEPAWSELKAAALAAQERLGEVLRGLMGS